MRTPLALITVAAAMLSLAACSAAPPGGPSPDSSPTASTTAAATAAPEASPTSWATSAPTLIASDGVSLADAEACGDGVVLAAAAIEAGSETAASWLESAEAQRGFSPAAALGDAPVLCAVTFRAELDGAEEPLEISTAYARGADVGTAVQAWAEGAGYTALDPDERHPTFVLGSRGAPDVQLHAFRLDWDALGENDVAWHELISGFELEPDDWVVTRVGSTP